MENFEFTGKNVEKAIENGLKELNKTREEVDITVISEGGLFSKAKILMTISEEEALEVKACEAKEEAECAEHNCSCEHDCNCEESCSCGDHCDCDSCCDCGCHENDDDIYELETDDGEIIKTYLILDVKVNNKEYRTFEVAETYENLVEEGDFLAFEIERVNDDIKLKTVEDENLIDEIYNEVERQLEAMDCECDCHEHECNHEERNNEEEKPAKVYMTSEEVYEEINNIFSTIFNTLNIDGKVMILENDESYEVKIMGDENIAKLIGFRGEGLNAYQFLINNFISLRNKSKKIYIDVENYRSKREESLKALAVRIAKKVLKTKRRHKFEPMTAYERHVIHEELANFKGVTTHSEGNEPHRCLIVDIER